MSAGAGRDQLSLQQAGEALKQWHSRPCLIVVTSSLLRQPARLRDTERVRYRIWL